MVNPTPTSIPDPTSTAPLYVAQDEFHRLRSLAASMPKDASDNGRPTLRSELDRAVVLERGLLPPGVVTINSRVQFKDVESGEVDEYILTWPERADASARRLSVLAPVGSALIGLRVGGEIAWPTPGGTRRLQIVQVDPVVEEPAVEDSGAIVARLLYGGQ